MAIDMFLELDGIKGESLDDKHKNKIDVLDWGWGLSNTGTFHQGSGGGAGRANFKAFTIRKYIDAASCALMHYAACGKRITKGSFYIRKAGGNPLEYLVFQFSNVTVTHVTSEVRGERGTETIALNFSRIETEYKTQDAKGLGKVAGVFEAEPKSFENISDKPAAGWNKTAAVSYLNAHANSHSLGRCAEYVRRAVEAGGLRLQRHTSAKDYGTSLNDVGFVPVDTEEEPQAGDVAVIEPIAGHPHGHMTMFNGTIWISDFKQLHGVYPGPSYRSVKPKFVIYRYPSKN